MSNSWCKSNCNFSLLKFTVWYWNIFLNKCHHVIYHFNEHFLFCVFLLMTLLSIYFIFILDYGSSDNKASAYNAGDSGSIPRLGRSPEERNGNPLQYSCLENPMDQGAWWATVHGVAESRTRLSDFTFFFHFL